MNIGDVHRGDSNCNISLFLKAVAEVRDHKDMYWLSTGDLLNVALKTSISDCYTGLSLNNELDAIVKELTSIAHKCLGIVSSNHHRRLKNLTGLDLDLVICNRLGIPYLGKLALVNVVCGRSAYYIALHHGIGAGRKRGSKANNMQMLSELIPGADIYMEGHTHTHDYFIDEQSYIDRKRIAQVVFPAHFCTTGHFLDYDGSYAEDMKLPRRPQGATVLRLSARVNGAFAEKSVKADFFC